jgi:hypothetical protein
LRRDLPRRLLAAILRPTMNASEKSPKARTPFLSPEAIIGIGVTVAELGLLCLLLGWAEKMRGVTAIACIWLPLGAVLFILGGLAAAFGSSKRRRP